MPHTKRFIKLIRVALIIFGVMLLQLVFLACMGNFRDKNKGNGDNAGGEDTIHGHKLLYHPAASPTCVTLGNVEYWKCSKCGLMFEDEDGETAIENVSIPSIEHEYEYSWDGTSHYRSCSICAHVLDGSSVAHTKRFDADRTSHYQYCECGWKSRAMRHSFVDGGPCSECGFGGLLYELSSDGSYYICTGAPDSSRTTVAEYIIPDEYDGLPVKEIGERAFDSCAALEKITLGNNVHTIGEYAFKGCGKLMSVSLNEGLTHIKESAFTDCRSLVSIEIPATVTDIMGSAFRGCTGLKTVNIPEGLTELPDRMFFNCTSLASLTIPSSVTKIGVAAFSRSGLKSLTIPDGVTVIPQTMAESCSALEAVNLPASVKSIGIGAFMNCKALTTLNYAGTEDAWAAVTLGNMWNRNSESITIVCADPNETE